MSYRKPREKHSMSVTALFWYRYTVCTDPGCERVRRAWWAKPLIHKGGKP